MNIKRRLAAATTTALLTATTACGTTHHTVTATTQPAALSYTPNAYGQNNQCYYIDSPQEAYNLIAAGLCPPGWQPAPMPLSWHEEYLDYYDSPVYYNAYVPTTYRSGWLNQWGPSSPWYQTNKTTIIVIQKHAIYKGSNGSTVTGPVTNFAPPKTTSAPLPVGAHTAGPLPVGGARNTAPAPSAPKPLPVGGARPTPPRVVPR